MVRELPLNPLWESLGATLKVEQDWRLPSIFRDFQYEYTAVRKGVGLIDLSYRGKIEVTGKDRVSFLHRMLTNDVQSLGLGDGCYAALLSAQGKILMDMNLLVLPNSILIGTEIGLEKKLIALLFKFVITEDVQFRDVTEDYALIALQGPRSEALAQALFPGPFPELTKRQHANFDLGDASVMLVRMSRTGTWGYHLQIPKEHAVKVAERVMVVGKLYGLRPVGFGASEILRIEAGVLRYGIDINEEVLLPETGLEAIAVSETKGCYPGQEVVARIKTYGGLNRTMTGLIFTKGALPAHGDKVIADGSEAVVADGSEAVARDGKEIGWTTSACHSPALDKGIALAYLAKGYFEAGKNVRIKTRGSEIEAETSNLPFISPSQATPPESS